MSARAMLLTELLPDVAAIPAGLTITGLSQDSRAVRPGMRSSRSPGSARTG